MKKQSLNEKQDTWSPYSTSHQKKNITIIHKYKSIKEKYTKKETDTHNNNDDDNTKV